MPQPTHPGPWRPWHPQPSFLLDEWKAWCRPASNNRLQPLTSDHLCAKQPPDHLPPTLAKTALIHVRNRQPLEIVISLPQTPPTDTHVTKRGLGVHHHPTSSQESENSHRAMAAHKSGGKGAALSNPPSRGRQSPPGDNVGLQAPLLSTIALTKLAQPCCPGGLQPGGHR